MAPAMVDLWCWSLNLSDDGAGVDLVGQANFAALFWKIRVNIRRAHRER